jgi:opacity protein-like surface antigen
MRKLLGLVGVATLIAGAPTGVAHAQGMFVEGSAGITTQDHLKWGGGTYSMDQGWNASAAIGQSFWTNWDGEAEFSYDKMEYSCCNPNNTHEYRLMANLTRNFQLAPSWTVYAGGGVGAAWVKYENHSVGYTRSDTVPAWQAIGGVRWAVSPQWSLFGEYRYQDNISNPKDQGLEWEHKANNFALGVRMAL